MPRVLRVKGRPRTPPPVRSVGPPAATASPSVFDSGLFDNSGSNDVFGPAPPSPLKARQIEQRFSPGETRFIADGCEAFRR